MLGTIANVIAVTAGGILGVVIGRKLRDRYVNILFQALGLVTMGLGFSMVLESNNLIIAVVSMVLGSLIGEALNLERGLEKGANALKRVLPFRSERFNEGFITATILYCVGSMAILGSIEDGLGLFPKLLYTKSIMDGISSVALAAAMGIGVVFSIIPVALYQGLLTLFASGISSIMSSIMIAEITSVGGLILIGIGLNLLKIKHVSVTNMLPAIVIAPLLAYFFL